MESKYEKKAKRELKKTKREEQDAAIARDNLYRKLTLQAHKIETLLIKLVIDVSDLNEVNVETHLKHSLDSIKKTTRILAKGSK